MSPKERRCKDCVAQGVTTKRPAPHPGPRCASHNRERKKATRATAQGRRLEQVYGITAEEAEAILQHQGGSCFICQRATGATRALAIDHDHQTGLVRGRLCKPCNRMLGHARDDEAFFYRAQQYLAYPPAFEVIGKRRVPEGGAPVRS